MSFDTGPCTEVDCAAACAAVSFNVLDELSWTITANYNSKQWNVIREQAYSPLDFNSSPYVIDYPAIDGGWTVGDQYSLGLRNYV